MFKPQQLNDEDLKEINKLLAKEKLKNVVVTTGSDPRADQGQRLFYRHAPHRVGYEAIKPHLIKHIVREIKEDLAKPSRENASLYVYAVHGFDDYSVKLAKNVINCAIAA